MAKYRKLVKQGHPTKDLGTLCDALLLTSAYVGVRHDGEPYMVSVNDKEATDDGAYGELHDAIEDYPIAYGIDWRVVPIVRVLNDLGAITFSSCGGHDNPQPGQCPAGEFYVNFDLPSMAKGWRILTTISEVVSKFPEWYTLTVWTDGGTHFELRGKGGNDEYPAEEAEREEQDGE